MKDSVLGRIQYLQLEWLGNEAELRQRPPWQQDTSKRKPIFFFNEFKYLIIFSLNQYFNESQLTTFEAIVECSDSKTVVCGEVASCFFYIYTEEEEENWFHEVRALASISRHRAKSSTRSYKIKC